MLINNSHWEIPINYKLETNKQKIGNQNDKSTWKMAQKSIRMSQVKGEKKNQN